MDRSRRETAHGTNKERHEPSDWRDTKYIDPGTPNLKLSHLRVLMQLPRSNSALSPCATVSLVCHGIDHSQRALEFWDSSHTGIESQVRKMDFHIWRDPSAVSGHERK